MKILLAPDKFKGTFTAEEVCGLLERGLRSVLTDSTVVSCPIADGGDGFADVLCNQLEGKWVECGVHDAVGKSITAQYALCGKTAVMEMSSASGIRLIPEELRDIWRANTVGTGEMMRHAIESSAAEKIVMGIGGSATNDGGFGMASALGVRFYDDAGGELFPAPENLKMCQRVDFSQCIKLPEMLVACDVENPLLGVNGAASVYGPQKGATEEDIQGLETWMGNMVSLLEGEAEAGQSGAGAAGGLGFGLMKFCNASLMSGFDLVAQETGLLEKIQQCDVVITGEGMLDAQTLQGKGPAGVAEMARNLGKKVIAVAGIVEPEVLHLFDAAYALHDDSRSIEETVRRGEELLLSGGAEIARDLQAQSI